ncbi:MAG: [protein-PII] uridylyltransferase [Acidimicrobiales bacterium]
MSFRSAREELLRRAELKGDAFCAALADAADSWLGDLLAQAAGADATGLALVAVGGYGRGELAPFSDLDVVLVHARRKDISRLADALWYPVWDEGVRLDHSVRRPDEVLAVAREDLRAQLGLLDGRLVAGDPDIATPLLDAAERQWRDRAGPSLVVLTEQVRMRHAEHGDVAFLLEPDLKEAHGGLRDVHLVAATALAVPAIAEQVDLSAMDEPRRVLTAARVELHRLTGRATDRLLLQEQDQVAASLGYGDADVLMAAIAEAGRTIAWVADDAWRRRYLWSQPRRRQLGRLGRAADDAPAEQGPMPVEPGIAVARTASLDAEVVLTPDADPEGDVTLPLRLAAAAAERGLPVGRAALDVLAEQSPKPGDPWPKALLDALVRVLSAGARAIPAIEALEQRELLSRVLPEWKMVRNRPQRNAYHRFTVDRHLLEAATGAALLCQRVARPDLLLVGTLLHDLGKGYEGDHTEVGIELVARIGPRMGLGPDDVAVLETMVRLHLLLPDVATRRDLDDPATVDLVARAVGDVDTLDLLAALTEADSLATGPAAWGSWKAGLVADLVQRVRARLSGAVTPAPLRADSPVDAEQHALVERCRADGRTVVASADGVVTVVALDRSGLLSAVTGVLALRGLDVRSADVRGEDGVAVEVFVVEPARGRWPDFAAVGRDVDEVLAGTLALEERLAEQARLYRPSRPMTARPASSSVHVDNGASASATVVEVRTADALGLLHRVTRALFETGLDVTAARVSTIGHEVVDAFYVREGRTGAKVLESARLVEVREAVRRAIGATA